jgi:non-heme chloroperoxidase
MATITTKDGTQIYYKDWGKGQPIVFSHGWPLSADDWDGQMLFFGQRGYRVIAHDRRGHGRSKAALISAITPLMLKTEKNPTGTPLSAFDELRAALAANRPQFYKDITLPFYGYNRPGAKISEGIREHWWLQGMLGGVKAHYDCIKVFSETDLTEDLKKIDIPVLVQHSDDDQIVPIAAAGPLAAKLLKKSTLKVYHGLPHGMPATNADQINGDLLSFFKSAATAAA